MPRNRTRGACCLGLPAVFRSLKELLSMYLGNWWCYFDLEATTTMNNNKSSALRTLASFYSCSFPLLLRIQAAKTNYFCKFRKWDMFLDKAYHIVPIYPLPKMLDLCALTELAFASWGRLTHCQLALARPVWPQSKLSNKIRLLWKVSPGLANLVLPVWRDNKMQKGTKQTCIPFQVLSTLGQDFFL